MTARETGLLEALRESQSLLVAMLGEKRPDEEIEEQIMLNRSAMNAAGDYETRFQGWTSLMSIRAAAPDLLNALKRLLPAAHSNSGHAANCGCSVCNAKAVIARVTGTAP